VSSPEHHPSDPAVLAVVHRAADGWRGLVASTDGPRPRVIDTAEFSDGRALPAWLREHGAGGVLCVLPASTVICRTMTLPDAGDEQLDQALHLQAEAHLVGIAPPHRMGMAVLPGAPGETSRCGIVLAWPEAATFDPPPVATTIEYAADVAALAALLDDDRPADPLMWVDRGDGSVALALSHANGAVFRAARENADSVADWTRQVSRVLAETALSVGHTPAFVDSAVEAVRGRLASLNGTTEALVIPRDIIEAAVPRLDGAPGDPRWWSEYGVAAGALLARTGRLAPLTHLRSAPPREAPSRSRELVERLSRPRTAAFALLACALVLLLGPLVVHGLRLQILSLRHPDLDEQLAAVEDARRQRAMYEELDRRAWPMTKLLSDIACNTPRGIELETLRITQGEIFTVSGLAKPVDGRTAAQVVEQMLANLNDSAIFADVGYTLRDGNAYGAFEFDLSANVVKPTRINEYPEELDYGRWTLAMRRDGEQPGDGTAPAGADDADATPAPDEVADATPPVAGTTEPAGDTPTALVRADDDAAAARPTNGAGRTPRTGRRPTGDAPEAGSRSAMGERSTSGIAPSQDIPEILTPDQISALTVDEARDRLGRVAAARRYARGDDELQTQLKEQFELLMERVRKGDA
jgi:Tfp pilus assembly protein PilN